MGTALGIVLLAASAAPVSAGFRYVPPEQQFTQVEEDAPGAVDIEHAPGPGPAVSGTGIWQVHEGEMLRAVLARWGARAGTDVLFLTDRRYRLDGAAAFEGGFMDAVQGLFRSLSHLPHAPVAARSEGGMALVVRNRLPASPAGRGKP